MFVELCSVEFNLHFRFRTAAVAPAVVHVGSLEFQQGILINYKLALTLHTTHPGHSGLPRQHIHWGGGGVCIPENSVPAEGDAGGGVLEH